MKGGRKLKKIFIVLISLVLAASFASVSFAGIAGSAHDFSDFMFAGGAGDGTGGGQICIVCHTPHNGDTEVTEAPLWNHELSFETYNLYSSPTLQATVGQPDGSAKLCLSCHDGTIAVDAYGGQIGTVFMADLGGGHADLTTDLSNDHPISFTYDDALATADGALFPPTSTPADIGSGTFTKQGNIDDTMLEGGTVLQCSSCHSVHNDFVADDAESQEHLLKISIVSSELCLTCHNK
jgi:hypothetical protein